MIKPLTRVLDLGRLDFKTSFRIQKHLVDQQLSPKPPGLNYLILVEHDPPVYTLGLRRNDYIKSNQLELLKQSVKHKGPFEIEMTDRGGLITFHGPGQLVAYPIVNLKTIQSTPSLRRYVWQLEESVIDLCRRGWAIEAKRVCRTGYTGVWVDEEKIAALGVHCKRYVTYHGLAFNFDVDLEWYEHIVPCGISDKRVTSLNKLVATDRLGDMNQLKRLYLESFKRVFELDRVENASRDEVDQIIKDRLV